MDEYKDENKLIKNLTSQHVNLAFCSKEEICEFQFSETASVDVGFVEEKCNAKNDSNGK